MGSGNKSPQLLTAAKDYMYTCWKKSIQIWSKFTTQESEKQGAAVFLTPGGPACDAALALN